MGESLKGYEANDTNNMDTKEPIIDTIWLKGATPVRFCRRKCFSTRIKAYQMEDNFEYLILNGHHRKVTLM